MSATKLEEDRHECHTTPLIVISGPSRALERPASQEGDLGLARVCARRVDDRQRDWDEDPGHRSERGRRVRTGRAHPRQRLPEASGRAGTRSRAMAPPRATPPSEPLSATSIGGSRRFLYEASRAPTRPATPARSRLTGIPRCFASRSPATKTRPPNRVGATLKATAAAQAANPGFTIEQVGDASINKQINDSISNDFKRAFVTSLPITLVILLIAFGALVAACVPLLLG